MKGLDYLNFMARFYARDEAETKEFVERAVAISGLGERLKDKAGTYSKGMTRKLLLARALMTKPALAILDEPTSGLDVINSLEVREMIKGFTREGVSVLLSSHNMLEVEFLSDRVALIDRGVVLDSGTPQALKEKYQASNLGNCLQESCPMKNFSHLLIKEIKELLNKQLIISLVFILVIFYFIGNVTRSEMKRAMAKQKVAVLDLDQSEISRNIIGALNMARFIIEEKSGDKQKVVEEVRDSKLDLLVVIPEGSASWPRNFQPAEVETYSFLRGLSIAGRTKTEVVKALLNSTNEYLSNEYLKKKIPEADPKLLKAPIKNREFVVVQEKQAEGSVGSIVGALMAQNTILPIILMMIIMYSAQMVITAIAMEKQNKTLETLLTVPVSRGAIVMAKMLAAAVVGLLSAVVYMYGFQNAFTFSEVDISQAMGGVTPVLKQLGLTISTQGYILFGISLFLTILCALALATILGVLAEDYRTAQSLSVPLVF